jgi:heme exporter protein C
MTLQKITRILAPTSIVMMAVTLYLIYEAPNEATMGVVYKVFYFHVPNAVLSYGGPILLGLASIMFLATGNLKWDRFGSVSAEVGILFASTAIATGMIWGKPAWGAYWVSWDPRLNLQLLLFLTLIAYVMLRHYVSNRDKRATLCCVFGLLALINVPFNWLSIYFMRTQHPQPVVGPGGGGIDSSMQPAFYASFLTWFVIFAYVLLKRLELAAVEEKVEELESAVAANA